MTKLGTYLPSSTASTTCQTIANMTNYLNNVSTVNTDAGQNIKLTSSGNALSLDYSNLMTKLGTYLPSATASTTYQTIANMTII